MRKKKTYVSHKSLFLIFFLSFSQAQFCVLLFHRLANTIHITIQGQQYDILRYEAILQARYIEFFPENLIDCYLLLKKKRFSAVEYQYNIVKLNIAIFQCINHFLHVYCPYTSMKRSFSQPGVYVIPHSAMLQTSLFFCFFKKTFLFSQALIQSLKRCSR